MTATTREDLLTDTELLTPSVDAAALEGAELEEAIAGLESQEADEAADPKTPLIKIVKGNPSEEEIGALVAVFTAAAEGAGDAVTDPRPPETWGSPTRMHRGHGAFSPHSFGNPVAARPS
ncbi:acyl-CoA carboxylase subunit epsilon [Rhodococcus xishaensis]|uniref:Acyl-CoA carboxylase subunit epsilon n=1 Tax=Rhodococcus xishaensis TaxID=2487364 RepID=A0A438B2N5_9NOCA|nr:acyl-CoA carboxylase subunit epsilon [Rhodococcus xishaensis]RVW05219.1 acyl-CoA carboxylase subunit epsilon [Rhodococcus xishaensis]